MGRRRDFNEDSISVKLNSGGSITLTFRGNLFELLPGERQLLSDLSTTVQGYNSAAAQPTEAPLVEREIFQKI